MALVVVTSSCGKRREETILGDHHLSRVEDLTLPDGASEWHLIVFAEPRRAAHWSAAVGAAAQMAHEAEELQFSTRDIDGDGAPDYAVAKPETRTFVIWDGSSIPADGPVEVVSILDDLDGDAMHEIWVRRPQSATTFHSASGLASTEPRETGSSR
jgi:hypothetical protein